MSKQKKCSCGCEATGGIKSIGFMQMIEDSSTFDITKNIDIEDLLENASPLPVWYDNNSNKTIWYPQTIIINLNTPDNNG